MLRLDKNVKRSTIQSRAVAVEMFCLLMYHPNRSVSKVYKRNKSKCSLWISFVDKIEEINFIED